MTYDEIEQVLGKRRVDEVEGVFAALVQLGITKGQPGVDAVEQLIVALLAAQTVAARKSYEDAIDVAERYLDIVELSRELDMTPNANFRLEAAAATN